MVVPNTVMSHPSWHETLLNYARIAAFQTPNAIPHTCRRRQLPSTRRSYSPALGADRSRLNLRLNMHRHFRSTTSASSNDTHSVCA